MLQSRWQISHMDGQNFKSYVQPQCGPLCLGLCHVDLDAFLGGLNVRTPFLHPLCKPPFEEKNADL